LGAPSHLTAARRFGLLEAMPMKITVNIDCTPEEARAFFGLPNIAPMQDSVLKEMQDRLATNIRAMDPGELFKTWMQTSPEVLKQWRDMFFGQTNAKE
jgi:hypothetical protein